MLPSTGSVASARLAEVLLLDSATLLEPVEPPFLQVAFFPVERSAEELMPIALNNRPEIASRRELFAAAEQILRQERNRPLLPNIIVTTPSTTTGLIAAGTFGNVIRFLAPLTVTDDELDEGLEALAECFAAVASHATVG